MDLPKKVHSMRAPCTWLPPDCNLRLMNKKFAIWFSHTEMQGDWLEMPRFVPVAVAFDLWLVHDQIFGISASHVQVEPLLV